MSLGDYNAILSNSGKRGGLPSVNSSSRGFRGLMNNQSLIDLGFSGNAFNLSNKIHAFAIVKDWLDRVIVYADRALFPRALVRHFPILHQTMSLLS
jgi:hypothetical protein